MHIGKFVFAQITQFLPQRQFRRILAKYDDRTKGWSMSHWNHLLVLMFGQLTNCDTLRELTDITIAHGKKSKHLGFGHKPINRQLLSKANLLRDHRIFEEFAFYTVAIAQSKRITKEFSCMVGSTLWNPRLSTSVCRYSNGLSLEPQSLVSESTLKLISLPRYLYSIESPMQKYMMSTLWIGLHTSHLLAMYLIEATLTFPDSSPLNSRELSILYEKSLGQTIPLKLEKIGLKERTMYCETKPFASLARGTKRTTRSLFEESFTMRPIFKERSLTTRTTFILQLRILHSCISTDGKSKYFSSGLSSISESNNFGENLRTQSEYRYTLQSSHTVSLQSLNTTSKLADQSLKLCVSLVSPCLPLTAFKNSFSHSSRRRENQMMDNSVLSLKMIDIF